MVIEIIDLYAKQLSDDRKRLRKWIRKLYTVLRILRFDIKAFSALGGDNPRKAIDESPIKRLSAL